MEPNSISRQRIADLSRRRTRAICQLYDRVWPQPGPTLAERCALLREAWNQSGREVFGVWAGDQPRALAMIFPRVVTTAVGRLRVLALAGVCSAPELRGGGLGAAVVRAAFAEVDEGRETVSLFQTSVPGFYAKLGARSVGNVFMNPQHRQGDKGSAAQPWWDSHVMIYPAAYRWPEGVVDLGGAGY